MFVGLMFRARGILEATTKSSPHLILPTYVYTSRRRQYKIRSHLAIELAMPGTCSVLLLMEACERPRETV